MKIKQGFFTLLLIFTVGCKKEEANADLKSRAVGTYLCKGKIGYSTHTPPYGSKEFDTTVEIYVTLKNDSTLEITPNLVNGNDITAPIIGYDNDTIFFAYPSHSVSYKNHIYKNSIIIRYAIGWTSSTQYYHLYGSKK